MALGLKTMFANGLMAVAGDWIGAKLTPLDGLKLFDELFPALLRMMMSRLLA
jgi:hypothetical protein